MDKLVEKVAVAITEDIHKSLIVLKTMPERSEEHLEFLIKNAAKAAISTMQAEVIGELTYYLKEFVKLKTVMADSKPISAPLGELYEGLFEDAEEALARLPDSLKETH